MPNWPFTHQCTFSILKKTNTNTDMITNINKQILRILEYIINIFVLTFQSFSYRHLFKHIIQSYLPTTIVVIISWLSFMIPPASFPGRSGLLSLLILCIMNIMLNIIGQSPLISGICGLTIWCIICLFMVISFQTKHNL